MTRRSPHRAAPTAPAALTTASPLYAALTWIAALAVLVPFLTGCAGRVHTRNVASATVRQPPATTVPALRVLVHDGAPGAASLITRDGRFWASRFSTAGVADLRTGRRMDRFDHFRAGSLTKTLVATVILQLVAERKLSLDDPASAHLPPGTPHRAPGGHSDLRKVTVRQLLDHTSGLFNYTQDRWFARQMHGTGFDVHRYAPHTPVQLLRLALRHRPVAAPGARYSYANTNYLVLGLIIRGVTGHSYATEIRRRILLPAGLDDTSFPGHDPALPRPHGRAYSRIGGREVDSTFLDPSLAGAAGEMVTTLDDLNRFFAALLSGTFLAPRQMAEMRDEQGTGGTYGLGLYATRLPCGVTVWGHNGDINGSFAETVGTADGRHLVSYRVNTDSLARPAHGTALLEAEFCRADA
ncbi:serine hydrolase domain-containing protein [Streptomyces gilvosporeus]|uniref:Serine hydrolase n=1 Tax=Streptomyces gilvosporeus TaxID=553510 RepID=A0A1V0TSD6_9ACTN|nr:serine hydrolase domain-containing protein [Streptomyces gilvosporeus]ARF55859.1 serine hydrolase [Streptomyces gilvosporeus]